MAARVPLEAMEQIALGVDHAEGICLTPDGTVYLSGERGQIYRLEADDSVTEVVSTGGWTLGLAADAVNVKAKTAERMGPVGEGRAIEARAVCLLQRP